MQSILKLTQLDDSAPKDSRFDQITLRHLLESNSGMDQGLFWEGTDASVAAKGTLPVSHEELARFAAGRDLTGDPGSKTNVVYGNFDYFMISQVVARLANTKTFEEALQRLVLTPLQMSRTREARSLEGAQPSDEARYHLTVYDPSKKISPLMIGASVKTASQPTVAAQYGAWDNELFDGAGGLSSAVIDVARLAAMLSCRSNNPVLPVGAVDGLLADAANATATLTGPDNHGYHGLDWAYDLGGTPKSYKCSKGGWLPGQGTIVQFKTGRFGYVIAQNGNRPPAFDTGWLEPVAAVAETHSWSSQDLFGQYGMSPLTAGSESVGKAARQAPAISELSIEEQARASFERVLASLRK
jgi:CubicO group peptidase (beta-lactamase class C family)